jgi:hypothetical protein
LATICVALVTLGCPKKELQIRKEGTAPYNPLPYSYEQYKTDVNGYSCAVYPKDTTTFGDTCKPEDTPPDLAQAKRKRNDIAYGLMNLIDVVYGEYYIRLFFEKNTSAVAGDALTLGLSAASSIATRNAAKTIFSALGTGLSGVSLSLDKNFFAQQTFPVIGVAMQTRRDKIRSGIITNLALDTDQYPLQAAKRDLVAYLYAGTLASGLQELQEEAGAATAKNPAPNSSTGPSAPSGLTAIPTDDATIYLQWPLTSGAATYNVYYAQAKGVSPNGASVTKAPDTISTNFYSVKTLKDGTPYFFIVTAVNATGQESAPSNEVSATPQSPAAADPAKGPASLHAVSTGSKQVQLVWTPATVSSGTTLAYNVYYSQTKDVAPGGAGVTKVADTISASPYTVKTGLADGTPYYFVVTAVIGGKETPASPTAGPVTPGPAANANQMLLQRTPH